MRARRGEVDVEAAAAQRSASAQIRRCLHQDSPHAPAPCTVQIGIEAVAGSADLDEDGLLGPRRAHHYRPDNISSTTGPLGAFCVRMTSLWGSPSRIAPSRSLPSAAAEGARSGLR